MKKHLIWILVLVLISSAYAIRECGNINYLNEECRIITPADTSCTTLDIILDDGTVDVDDGVTTLLTEGTGMYYYDYTPTNEVGHCVICIDNTSGCFNVINYNYATQTNITETNTTISPSDIEEELADKHGVGSWLSGNTSAILNFTLEEMDRKLNESHGEGTWTTYVEDTSNRIYWLALLIALVLFILSKMTETKEFAIFAGIIVVAMAIYSGQYGFYGLDNDFLETVFLIILWGVGVYLILKSAMDMIKEGGL